MVLKQKPISKGDLFLSLSLSIEKMTNLIPTARTRMEKTETFTGNLVGLSEMVSEREREKLVWQFDGLDFSVGLEAVVTCRGR